jgi:type VI protein secretion system component VasF
MHSLSYIHQQPSHLSLQANRNRLPRTLASHYPETLLNAANPILSLLAYTPMLCQVADPTALFQSLTYEIQTFEAKLRDDYPPPVYIETLKEKNDFSKLLIYY